MSEINYKTIYQKLCLKGKSKRIGIPNYGRWEKHNIKPRHKNGTNDEDNLTKLQHKEHTLAHLLLYKIYGDAEDILAYRMMKGVSKDWWDDKDYRRVMKAKVIQNLKSVNREKQKEASRLAGIRMYRSGIGIHTETMHRIAIQASQEWAKQNPLKASGRSSKSHLNRTQQDYVNMANTKSQNIIIAPDGTEYKSVAEAEYYTGIKRTTLDNWSRRNTNNWSRRPKTARE